MVRPRPVIEPRAQPSPDSPPSFAIEARGDRLVATGALDIRSLADAEEVLLRSRSNRKGRALDLSRLDRLDTPGALLLRTLRNEDVELTGVRPEHKALIALVSGLDLEPLPQERTPPRWRELVVELGKGADEAWKDTLDVIAFVGRAASGVGHAVLHPREFRLPAISRQVAETGVYALPIVGLLAVMISIVIAYQGIAQLRPYGGENLTVDLVAVSVLREMGVLITAILVAGRSGSAFTAELGVMQAREEIDALKVMGLDPMVLLVLPRIVGLVITLPLLTFYRRHDGARGRRGDRQCAAGHIAAAVCGSREARRRRQRPVRRPVQGAGLRVRDRRRQLHAWAARPRFGGERRPRDDARRREGDLPRDRPRRAVLDPVREARAVSAPPRAAKPAEPILSARGIVNRFGAQTVHDHIGLDVLRGEILGIAGGSGSGKSVLLKTLVGLRRPDAGEVLLKGKAIAKLGRDERARLLGVLFQQGALFSSLSVAQNIMLPIREHTSLPATTQEKIAAMKLALAGMPADAGIKFPAELSGGMIKRAALARALALDPEILFLDEPTSDLDPLTASAIDAMIGELSRSLGVTVVVVTHDLTTLFTLCDRVAVLVDHKIAVDTLDRLLQSDQPWVHAFLHGPRARGAMKARKQNHGNG